MSFSLAVVSCSLSPSSKSALLAQTAFEMLKKENISVDFLDLREWDLPFCNGMNQSAYEHPNVQKIHDRLLKAQGILIAAPIYNYSVSGPCQNLIELTGTPFGTKLSGKVWERKIIGFIGQSGSPHSLMAPLSFFGSLILYFKATIVPQFVLSSRESFQEDSPSPEILKKVTSLTKELIRYTEKLSS